MKKKYQSGAAHNSLWDVIDKLDSKNQGNTDPIPAKSGKLMRLSRHASAGIEVNKR
jgi:hypothetical protein